MGLCIRHLRRAARARLILLYGGSYANLCWSVYNMAMFDNFGRPDLIKDADKKRWRLELLTPSSESKWSNMYIFDEDEHPAVENMVKGFNNLQSEHWRLRIVPNKSE